MRICLDLDGVIAELRGPDQTYAELAPVQGAVEAVRRLKAEGHYLIIFTARHMKTCSGNVGAVVARQGLQTLEWLARNGVVVDEVCFGKPHADLYIDDCGMQFTSWENFLMAFDPLSPRRGDKRRIGTERVDALRAPVLVVSAAGKGSRLAGAPSAQGGFSTPKALIEIYGRPMIWWALQSLRDIPLSKIIFVALKAHDQSFSIDGRLREIVSELFGLFRDVDVETVLLPDILNGQLLSVLEARDHFIPGRGVLIASCDTLVVSPLASDLRSMLASDRGLISLTEAVGEHWSFARVDEFDRVLEVAEKKRISDLASTGIYYFADAEEFLRTATSVTTIKSQVRGEYYVMPVYEEYLKNNWVVKMSRASEMWDMGERSALESFSKEVRESFVTRRFGSVGWRG